MTQLVETRFKAERGPSETTGRRAAGKRAGGRCEARIQKVCTGKHEATHHMKGRRVPDANDPRNLLCVCDECHAYIHAHPKWAREQGFMFRRVQ